MTTSKHTFRSVALCLAFATAAGACAVEGDIEGSTEVEGAESAFPEANDFETGQSVTAVAAGGSAGSCGTCTPLSFDVGIASWYPDGFFLGMGGWIQNCTNRKKRITLTIDQVDAAGRAVPFRDRAALTGTFSLNACQGVGYSTTTFEQVGIADGTYTLRAATSLGDSISHDVVIAR